MFQGRYTQNQLPSELFNATSGQTVTYGGQLYRVANNGDGTRTITPTSEVENIPAFSFNYDQAEQEARAKLEPYYKQKLDEAGGDIEKAKKLIEDDYTAGVRFRAEEQTSQLAQDTLAAKDESRNLLDTLNKRGVLFSETPPGSTDAAMPYSGLAQQELGTMGEKQVLRKQAIERAIARQSEVAGFDRRRQLEQPSMDLSRIQRNLKEEQEKRIQEEFVPMARERAREKYDQTYQQSLNQAVQRSLSANKYLQTAGWG